MSSKTTRDPASLRSFLFADGRQCRMLRKSQTSQFCYFHQRRANEVDNTSEAGNNISSWLNGDFLTSCSLNAFLSRLYFSVARGDFDPKSARTLGYLAHLVSKTLPGAKQELALSIGFNNMNQAVELWLAQVSPQFRPPRQPNSSSPQPTSAEPEPLTRPH